MKYDTYTKVLSFIDTQDEYELHECNIHDVPDFKNVITFTRQYDKMLNPKVQMYSTCIQQSNALNVVKLKIACHVNASNLNIYKNLLHFETSQCIFMYDENNNINLPKLHTFKSYVHSDNLLQRISMCKNIITLCIEIGSDEDLALLHLLPKLTALEIICQADSITLTDNMCRLTSLKIDIGNGFVYGTDKVLYNSNLKVLHLLKCDIPIDEVLPNTTIQTLIIEDMNDVFDVATVNTTIKHLSVMHNSQRKFHINSELCIDLHNVACFEGLESLHLDYGHISSLDKLLFLKHLKKLSINSCATINIYDWRVLLELQLRGCEVFED